MKKFIEDNILKILGISPFVLIGVGTLILNLYLSQYFISDFNIFQAKSFLTGLTFVSFLIFTFIMLFLWMDLKNVSENSIVKIIGNSIIKTIVISNILFLFLHKINPQNTYKYFVFNVSEPIVDAFCLMPIFFGGSLLFAWQYLIGKDKKKNIEWYVMFVWGISIIPTSIFAFLILYKNEPKYQQIFNFIIYLSLFVFSYLITARAFEKDRKKNLDIGYTSQFTGKKEKLIFDGVLVFGILIISFITTIFKYSDNIYPLIPDYIGGGKVEKAQIVEKNGTQLIGEIILKNTDGLFIKTSEDEIIVLKYEDIYKIRRDTTANSN